MPRPSWKSSCTLDTKAAFLLAMPICQGCSTVGWQVLALTAGGDIRDALKGQYLNDLLDTARRRHPGLPYMRSPYPIDIHDHHVLARMAHRYCEDGNC